jgi:hypothetical protein
MRSKKEVEVDTGSKAYHTKALKFDEIFEKLKKKSAWLAY